MQIYHQVGLDGFSCILKICIKEEDSLICFSPSLANIKLFVLLLLRSKAPEFGAFFLIKPDLPTCGGSDSAPQALCMAPFSSFSFCGRVSRTGHSHSSIAHDHQDICSFSLYCFLGQFHQETRFFFTITILMEPSATLLRSVSPTKLTSVE